MFLKYIIKIESVFKHNLDVAIVDYSYMFRLLQNNHHQAVFFWLWRCDPTRGHGLLILEVF